MRHLNFKYLFRLCAHTDTMHIGNIFQPSQSSSSLSRLSSRRTCYYVTKFPRRYVVRSLRLDGRIFLLLFWLFHTTLSLFLVALMLRHLFDNRRVGKRARERGKIDKICFQTLTTRLGVNCTVSIVLSDRTWTHKTHQCCAKKKTRDICETAEIYHRKYPATMEDIFVFPSWLILS